MITLALCTIASCIGLAILLWAITLDDLPEREGF